MTKNRPAAYQGEGWQPRTHTLGDDVANGHLWANYGVNSQFGELKDVVLFLPDPDTPTREDVNAIQHLRPTDYALLRQQMIYLREVYQNLGVNVHTLTLMSLVEDETLTYHYNLIYACDLFLMTPQGAILSRMGSMVRAGEEKHISHTLATLGVPIIHTICGEGTFEGPDAFWVRSDLVLVGVGNRTNETGFLQLRNCLGYQGVKCVQIRLPKVTQHLMGVLQIVDHDLAVIRGELLTSEVKSMLQDFGFSLIVLAEGTEVNRQQAMNFVTISPRKIVMVAGNPGTADIYRQHGIEVLNAVPVDELLNGAGGIACATGILNRGLL